MTWSFSAHRTFQQCPRQWFYKNILANARAKDPLRREAYRLSKLERLQAWRGKIVDTVLSETVIPSMAWRRPRTLAEAQAKARDLFEQQRAQRLAGYANLAHPATSSGLEAFFEVEYGLPLTDAMFAEAWGEIEASLRNFFQNDNLRTLLGGAMRLIPQRPLSLRHGEVTVRVVPDLIVFRYSDPPIVLDWKVNARPLRDYWLQLVTGAIALTRGKPHRDWPAGAANYSPAQIQLFEVQLLAGHIREHRLPESDVDEVEDFIAVSAMDMQLAGADEAAVGRQPEDYPVAHEPDACQRCPFRKLCWKKEV